ncbi:MAG: hypothetical protein COY58_07645 [Gammaproteobacteria bacterium CG_4_10_14_0_8_um_filter_38_16]|nr:MAG: hypothetical protein COY58_07645 [Gammaproteobacteria bacterium CG_4_10_14_0_8_um_filter_38_16]PJA03424.1 MAG: hypothetical protein COX72_04895 [Gammaproteobacteria bacterium CG_4_10_14_0_2_um_filter_38_22]PJB10579.1 MAG: hypothetical protein CO120_03785 [Gammaproteobacteria bacterium CG_4_9_14_3_um_filter_38_9]
MDKTSKLRGMLGNIFIWNKCRVDCFTQMLLALFIVRTINFSEIAVAMILRADVASRYKRLQRYFRIDYNVIAKFIFNLFVVI